MCLFTQVPFYYYLTSIFAYSQTNLNLSPEFLRRPYDAATKTFTVGVDDDYNGPDSVVVRLYADGTLVTGDTADNVNGTKFKDVLNYEITLNIVSE